MLEKLKLLLGIQDELEDAILYFCLKAAADAVKNYCNLTEIPKELETTVAQMAAGFYTTNRLGNSQSSGQERQTRLVASVTRGDVTTTFADPQSPVEATCGGGALELFGDCKAQLQPFRKVRWNM